MKADVDRLIAETEAAVKSPAVRAYKLAQDVLETSRGPWKDRLRTPSRTTTRALISILRVLTYVETAPPGRGRSEREATGPMLRSQPLACGPATMTPCRRELRYR